MVLEKVARIRVLNQSSVFVNMDQTGIWYNMAPRSTVDHRGSLSVAVKTGGNESNRVTVALCVCSDGFKLPPFVVYKGSASGRIAREMATGAHAYSQELVYACQDSAWFDERIMLLWIERFVFF